MSVYQARYNINDSKIEAGIDEAGRGPFWGPLMAAAVILPEEDKWTNEQRKCFEQVRDSKKIAEKKRQRIAEEIKQHVVSWGLGIVSADEIDDNGMTWSNQTAFARAIEQLKTRPDRIIVDGTLPLNNTVWSSEQHTVTNGDATYISIAAASILAKVHHDAWITEYCTSHPELHERYNLLKCKGYGTAAHIAGIREHGLDKHHRRLFLRKLLGSQSSYTPTILIQDDSNDNTNLTGNPNNCMIIAE